MHALTVHAHTGSPANVSLTFSADSSLFRLSWESPSTPLGYEPHNYTMTISYKDGSTESNTIETILAMNGTDSYTFDYVVSDDLLPLSSCSQFVFSVVSCSVMGDSQPVTLTWENEKSGKVSNSHSLLKLTTTSHLLVIFVKNTISYLLPIVNC